MVAGGASAATIGGEVPYIETGKDARRRREGFTSATDATRRRVFGARNAKLRRGDGPVAVPKNSIEARETVSRAGSNSWQALGPCAPQPEG